tara:strand:- start:4802 stop:5941 length:1140 start_codon:yes stop_codon:yes gene_type:complete
MQTEGHKIIVVDNSLYFTGAFNAIYKICCELREYYEFIFVLPEKSDVLSIVESESFSTYTLPFVELGRRPRNLLNYLPSLIRNSIDIRRIVHQNGVRILHVNDVYNLTGILVKLLDPSIGLVAHVRLLPHSIPLFIYRFWVGIYSLMAERMICVSQAVKKEVENPEAIVIYDGICRAEKYPFIKSPLVNATAINLLYLGNYIPGKGQNYALEAFKRAYREIPNLRLKFVGGTYELGKNRKFKESLVRKAYKYGLDNVITFEIETDNVEKEIKNADIVLNFSESESFSFTCLEALYYGTPLIVSDCGGPAELFEQKKSGYLVPNKDVNAMTKAIVHLAKNPAIRQKYSTESRRYVKNKIPYLTAKDSLKKIYDELLDGED